MSVLDDVLGRLGALSSEEQENVVQMALQATEDMLWVPNPGPQTDAFFCDADELFYGGEAGGGKSALECGLAVTSHQRSLLLRRTNKEAEGLVEELTSILGSRDGFNGQANVWRLPGRVIDIGGCQLEDDKQKYKGKPHDLICFDEVSDFTETQYTFIIGWNRSANPRQRCRVVAAGNPPTRPEGFWVIKRWAAWLDPAHPNPALDGELRWYTTGENGEEIEVDGPGPHMVGGELVTARSRTFIRAKLSDNPDLAATNYSAVLAGLPPALRAAYRDGRFDLNTDDDHWQVIPTSWVRAAQARWTERAPVGIPQCAIGCDVAQGGTDQTVLAVRHDGWFAPLIAVPGVLTPLGSDVAGLILSKRRDNAMVVIDVGGGWGADAYGHLKANEIEAFAYMGVKESVNRTNEGNLRFKNVRTEAYWRFREALNPDQPGGSPIMLPDDRELLADLVAPRYEPIPGGIKLEAKEDLVKRIGRSPDRGDAVVMSWFSGPKAITDLKQWQADQVATRRVSNPKVVMGHANRRRR
ncbi:terminase [Sphingomonas histidinilytica]|uniref:terminase n=1 Tax=Rhizorhabdus histidinilytica TaxID=439228 RepID=UPI001ADA4EAB|nr:terminase [Rhizorhabdus histidinilytica]MBO9380036.1 terminase [Rhizorhabdus histidinilytica]